ncbi:hypothetical protein MRB53_013795 [Persea americana]|uniref:Uncharacterized protein n=1 Tax=Persea americana TaxID=3435 RepID=A0ACC2K9I7_PERAE|nr:hypothetical protein MRB53_013795 [Persea americana]
MPTMKELHFELPHFYEIISESFRGLWIGAGAYSDPSSMEKPQSATQAFKLVLVCGGKRKVFYLIYFDHNQNIIL